MISTGSPKPAGHDQADECDSDPSLVQILLYVAAFKPITLCLPKKILQLVEMYVSLT